jgi:hypothetical protein
MEARSVEQKIINNNLRLIQGVLFNAFIDIELK